MANLETPIKVDVQATTTVKPGWATTEFLLAAIDRLLFVLVLALIVSGDISAENIGTVIAAVTGMLGTSLSSSAYSYARSGVKRAAADQVRYGEEQASFSELEKPEPQETKSVIDAAVERALARIEAKKKGGAS